MTDQVLAGLDERRRAEVVAAYTAVEHAAEPVREHRFPALREPVTRRLVSRLLHRAGRTLIRTPTGWISGYRDDIADQLAADPGCRLPRIDRAVLTLVLIHSVAIPRSGNLLPEDSWLSPYPTRTEDLIQRSMLGVRDVEDALRRLRHAGLVTQVKSTADGEGGYVPGPQFHRMTPRTRTRLQEELVLAAGPESPLAASIRARRRAELPERAEQPGQLERSDGSEPGDTGAEDGDASGAGGSVDSGDSTERTHDLVEHEEEGA